MSLGLGKVCKGLRNPRAAASFLWTKSNVLYAKLRTDSYPEFYLRLTKQDVIGNPEASVGPEELYEEMRAWQISFLTDHGLSPDDRLLDIGCGVLRGGVPIITYLNVGNYYGMDISEDALAVGRREIVHHNLKDKQPTLIKNEDLVFDEPAFSDVQFDVLWAQSVLTHLPPALVEELMANVERVLASSGEFYATYLRSTTGEIQEVNGVHFHYPFEYIETRASEYGLKVAEVTVDHPNDLDMLRFQWRQ